MNRIKNLIAVGAFSLLALSLPMVAMAQYNGQYDPYGRNGGYNGGGYGNGGYNNGYYGDIRSTLRDLKDRSRDLKRQVDRNRGGTYGSIFGGYNNRNNDRYLKDLANDFKKATERLESRYGNGRDQYRSQNEAQQVLSLGSQLDQEMRRSRSNGYIQNDWNQISNDLQVVANTYGYNNRNNRNNYPNNNYPNNYPNNGRINRPSWWPF